MDFIVFYDDDYADNGGIGFEILKTADEVIDFITKRMEMNNPENGLDAYQVFIGRKVQLLAKAFVTKIELRY